MSFFFVLPKDLWDLRSLADISLDTEFTGFTTRAEMFWVGVPTITLAGKALHNRGGYSLTHAVCGDYCVSQMVVQNLKDYEDKAVELATNPKLLAEVRR
jgi:protein O-GlcNAc transferase